LGGVLEEISDSKRKKLNPSRDMLSDGMVSSMRNRWQERKAVFAIRATRMRVAENLCDRAL